MSNNWWIHNDKEKGVVGEAIFVPYYHLGPGFNSLIQDMCYTPDRNVLCVMWPVCFPVITLEVSRYVK